MVALRSQTVRQASIIIAVATVVSQLLGILREAVIARFFGTSAEYDLLLMAITLPIMVGSILFVSIPLAGIPHLQRTRVPTSVADIFRSSVFKINTALILVVSAGLYLVLPMMAGLLDTNLGPEAADKVIRYGRIFCLLVPFRAYEAVFRALLQVRDHFIFPVLTTILFNIALITILYTLVPSMGANGFVLAWLVGMAVQTLVVAIPAAVLYARIAGQQESSPAGETPGHGGTYLRFLGIVMLVESIGLTVEPFDRWLGGIFLEPGYVSATNFANIVYMVPIRIVTYSMATAIFPTISRRAAANDPVAAAATYRRALAICILLVIPVAVFFYAYGDIIVRLLFERGRFDARSTAMTVEILQYFVVGMVFASAFLVQSRLFYALRAWRPLVTVRILGLLVKIGIGLLLINSNWALALGGGTAAMFVFMFFMLETHLISHGRMRYSVQDIGRCARAAVAATLVSTVIWLGAGQVGDWIGVSRTVEMFIVAVVATALLGLLELRLGITGMSLRSFFTRN